MTNERDDFYAALDSVRILSPTLFTLLGRRHEVSGSSTSGAGVSPVEVELAEALYIHLHCRVPTRGSATYGFSNWVGARDYADRLSAANLGLGTWQSGWTARSVEPDGRIVAERHGVRFWVPPTDFRRLGDEATGDQPGAVRIPKECFELASGFYMAYGNADDTRDAGNVLRIYWHLAPSGGERLVSLMTSRLNEAGIAFQFKLQSDPLRFQRTDPAVLYLARSDYTGAVPILSEIRAAIEPWLRSTVSLLVKRLAPGIGLAEDPGDGSSFGEHRGKLLAGIFTDPEWNQLGTSAARLAFLSSRLTQNGYDLDRLYLNPGSTDDFPPFEPRTH